MTYGFQFVAFGICYKFNDFRFEFGSHGGMKTIAILDNDSNLGLDVFLLCWYLVLYKYLNINESDF